MKSFASYIIAGTAAAAAPIIAVAQDAESGDPSFLEEVVVTAERVETNLQETPVAVTAFTSEQITQLGAAGVEDLQTFTPNLSITEDGDYGRMNPQFAIRGVGAGVSTAGVATERPVGLYVDGVFLARAQGSLLSVIDAESIEVLRGPQGTLFGRNTTGGAVVYNSKKPGDEFEASAQLTVGNFNRNDQQFSVNIPLSDSASIRGVYANNFTDGYVPRGDRMHGDRDEEVIRLQLHADLSDKLSLDLSATDTSFFTTGDPRIITSVELRDGISRGLYAATQLALVNSGEEAFAENDPRITSTDPDNPFIPNFCVLNDPNPRNFGDECDNSLSANMSLFTGNLTLEATENLTLKSITGYLEGDQIGSGDFPWSGAYNRPFEVEFETISQEFQALYQSDKLNLVAGAIYYGEEATEEEITISTSLNFLGVRVSEEEFLDGVVRQRRDQHYLAETTSYGLYAQGTYSVTDKLDLTAGLRWSSDEKDFDIDYIPTADDPVEATAKGSEKWTNTDWRLALSYKIHDDLMVYVSATEAYKSGIANDASAEQQIRRGITEGTVGFIDPEEALGLEIGMRSEWFDNRFRANLTAFQTDYTNRQASVLFLDPDSEIAQFRTESIGDVEFQGLEGEFLLGVTRELTLNATFGITRYEQEDNPDATLLNLPEDSFTLGATYDFDLANGSQISSSLNYGWQSEMWSSNELPPDESLNEQERTDSYGIWNGRITYTPESESWSASLFVNNLTDERYFTNANSQVFHFGHFSTPTGTYGITRNLARPRSYGITLSANF